MVFPNRMRFPNTFSELDIRMNTSGSILIQTMENCSFNEIKEKMNACSSD